MTKNFTDKMIQGLKGGEKKYYVREVRGFTIQVMPTGSKTFMYICELEGKKRYKVLGTYPTMSLAQAREVYSEAYRKVKKGLSPDEPAPDMEIQKEEVTTFGHFAELCLAWAEREYSPSWYKTIKLSLNNDVLPYWKDKEISTIRRRDAIELLERVSARSVGMTANVHNAARSVLDYALQREYIDANPMLRLSKVVPSLKVVARERVLSDSEIRLLWSAIDDGPGDPTTKRALKLILVTAQRPGEVAGMHRREIEGKWWIIPKERAEKGRGDHMVYLSPTALSLIGDAKGYIFPSPRPNQPIGRNALSQMVSTTMMKAGVVAKDPYYGIPRWTPHDLRRTARTCMARAGVIDEHAEAVLAHCKQGIKKVYNKYEYQEEKKQALLTWEAALLGLLSSTKSQPLAKSGVHWTPNPVS